MPYFKNIGKILLAIVYCGTCVQFIHYLGYSITASCNCYVPQQGEESGRKQVNYSIIGAAVPNFGNHTLYIDDKGKRIDSDIAWGFVFNLPMTALAWKRMGFSTIAVLTFDSKNIHPSARRLLQYVDKTLRRVNVSVIYFDMPSFMKVRMSQVLRFAGGELKMVNDGDFVITSDADLWPIHRSRYTLNANKDILITSPLWFPRFPANKKDYNMYPICNIAMTGRRWKSIFPNIITGEPEGDTYSFESIKSLKKELEAFRNSTDIYSHTFGETRLHLDRRYATVLIEDYLEEYGRIKFQFDPRTKCKRIESNRFQIFPKEKDKKTGKELCATDIHMFKWHPWDKRVWKELKKVAVTLFDDAVLGFIEKYKTVFEKAYEDQKYQIID